MIRPHRWPLFVALAGMVLLPACYVPSPAPHAVLSVSAAGAYALDGAAVEPARLAEVLQTRHAASPQLVLQISASPEAGNSAVQAAVAAARQAGVRIAFVQGPA